MKKLKGVIFSLRDVVFHSGKIDPTLFAELEKLILWLKKCGVTPVFVSNRPWVFAKQDGSKENVELVMNQRWGPSPWYIAARGDIPYKPQAAAIETVLQKQGWQHNEVIYVGNTDDDMKTARNGKVLFLNAQWHGQANPYGYLFDSPLDVARFIDCFCLNTSDWFWAIEKPPLRAYAVAPFSTLSRNYLHAQQYSSHARDTAKHLGGDATFWGRLLASRVYFSGLVDQINYITHYPGHSPQSKQPVVSGALTILADSLQRRYIPDLLLRHAAAKKSQSARTSGQSVDHLNQLNTICVEQHPTKDKKGGRYKTSPLVTGKSVLIVDDICTQGNSFEAARAYIRGTGAEAICLAWLKTINTDYKALSTNPKVQNPYKPCTFQTHPAVVDYPFSASIKNNAATVNLDDIFQSYYQWNWPK
ncbi:HAD hydrolase-like protein [Bradyrhizobium sp. C-145]|uniref:phosphoribosyltransferase family protein n=1 Tax=Bradyrhizobium sp. C-145 TaxID=574727 RepID=UPI00201B7DAD|nr:phosphoribosyltransferase family protein [Bradyrhizobium sp. C-145]UQR63206.1 HAD hydrolase-like protein [Bradyrhizobium sp. C-145]